MSRAPRLLFAWPFPGNVHNYIHQVIEYQYRLPLLYVYMDQSYALYFKWQIPDMLYCRFDPLAKHLLQQQS
jgi:hypothetical protein